jgi:molybdopterin converting factor small subunit
MEKTKIRRLISKFKNVNILVSIIVGIAFCFWGASTDESVLSIILLAVGASAIAAGVISALEKYSNTDNIAQLDEKYDTILDKIASSNEKLSRDMRNVIDLNERMEALGVKDIGNAATQTAKEKIRNCKEGDTIKTMLHTGEAFLNDFYHDVKIAIKNGCEVQILIAHPDISSDSEICINEANVFRKVCKNVMTQDIKNFNTTMKDFIDELKLEGAGCKGKITVKQYTFAPTGNTLIIGDWVRFIPYLSGVTSSTSIPIIGTAKTDGSGPFNTFIKMFDAVFDPLVHENHLASVIYQNHSTE